MMVPVARHVLLVGAARSEVEHLVPLLKREEIEVVSIPTDPAVLDLILETPFELIMIRFPLPDLDVAAVVQQIRGEGSASRSSGVLLLADEDALGRAMALLDRGVNRVVSATWADARIWRAVADLLEVAPRIDLRVPVMVDVELAREDVPDVCRSVNVSRTGIRLECPQPYPLGARIQVGLVLPKEGAVIRARAEVVRRTDPAREGSEGFAARFVALSEADERRLDAFVRDSLRA